MLDSISPNIVVWVSRGMAITVVSLCLITFGSLFGL